MKRLIVFIITTALIITTLAGCGEKEQPEPAAQETQTEAIPGLYINRDQSDYSNYWVSGDRVHLICGVRIVNETGCEQTFALRAEFPDDVKSGLLAESTIYAMYGEGTYFITIKPKRAEYHAVDFVGIFGGTDKKSGDALPDITIIPCSPPDVEYFDYTQTLPMPYGFDFEKHGHNESCERGNNYQVCSLHSDDYASANYYRIFDNNHKTVWAEGPILGRYPHLENKGRLVMYTMQAGTGISTQWGFFYDPKRDILSLNFNSIFDVYGDLVAYRSDIYEITVRNIFDKSAYHRTFSSFSEPLAPVAADLFCGVEFSPDGKKLSITYLSGEDYHEVTETFSL